MTNLLNLKHNLKNIPASDECYTPAGQIKFMQYLIPDDVKTIWCPCDKADSNIVKDLKQFGYDVIHTHIDDGFDFLKYAPIPDTYDAIITNPPYSIKDDIIKRCYELKVPFFLLLPLTAQEGVKRGMMFKKNGINVAVNMFRIDYTGKGKNWTNTSWFYGNIIGKRGRLDFIYNKD